MGDPEILAPEAYCPISYGGVHYTARLMARHRNLQHGQAWRRRGWRRWGWAVCKGRVAESPAACAVYLFTLEAHDYAQQYLQEAQQGAFDPVLRRGPGLLALRACGGRLFIRAAVGLAGEPW
jgi:hypothetical protein